jgi:hypothetical protein
LQYPVHGITWEYYLSGTEWEIFDALGQHFDRASKLPDVYIYCSTTAPNLPIDDDHNTEDKEQWARREAFVDNLQQITDGGINYFDDINSLKSQVYSNVQHALKGLMSSRDNSTQFESKLRDPAYFTLMADVPSAGDQAVEYVKDVAKPETLRKRALDVLFLSGTNDADVLDLLHRHLDEPQLRERVAALIDTHGDVVSQDIVRTLLNDERPVAKQAVRMLAELASRDYFSSKVFADAANHPAWEVRHGAIRAIINKNDFGSIQTLWGFRDTRYHAARSAVRKYLEARIDAGDLDDGEARTAKAILDQYFTDGVLNSTNTERARQTLERLLGLYFRA